MIGNPIYGNGNVVKWNTGTVTLNGSNTFTGSMIISNGVLQIGTGAAVGNAAVISLFNGSTLDASPARWTKFESAGQNLNCNGTVISEPHDFGPQTSFTSI